eukprot:Colp12_sorted_trinity150504_noHs@11554
MMSKQSSLSGFFKSPTQAKRPAESELEKENSPPLKKLKTDSGDAVKEPLKEINNQITSITSENKECDQSNECPPELQNGTSLEKHMGGTWYRALKAEFSKEYFIQLRQFLASERRTKQTVYPADDEVYSWSRFCAIDDVKVVIIGQDPYHGPGQAHGLCFSVKPGVPPPPSLVNIYKELTTDIEGFKTPSHGFLKGWAEQGVLLLNACLTVRKANANSHAGHGWEKFTDAVIEYLNKHKKGLVFVLWGKYAQKKGERIDKKKHCVIMSAHPSPLSARNGFFGSRCFSKANKYLEEQNKKAIDWKNIYVE